MIQLFRRGFSLRLKLFSGLLLLGALTAFVSFTGIRSLQALSHSFDDVNQQATPALTAVLQIDAGSSRLLADLVMFQQSEGSSTQEGSAAADAKNSLIADVEDLRGYQSDYNAVVASSTDANLLNEQVEEVVGLSTQLITGHEQGIAVKQLLGVQNQLHEAIDSLQKVVAKQVDISHRNLRERNEEVTTSTMRQTQGDIILVTVVLLLGLVIAALTARSIVRSLQQLRDGANAIAGGELDRHIAVTGRDELSELAVAFNNMSQKLQQSYSDLEHAKANVEHVVDLRTHELTAEKARFLASIHSLPLGFMLIETTGAIAMMNPAMRQILQLTDQALDGQADDQLLRQQLPLVDDIIAKCQTAITSQKAVTISELTSGNRYLRLLLSPVHIEGEAKASAAVALVEDITEDKIMQRSKDEFFSIASHELRTPLTAIRGNTSMIKEYYRKQLKDQNLNEMVDDIHNSSVRLITIVNDFLDTSRLEQGKMKFNISDFALEPIVEQIVYELDGLSHEKHIYLRMENNLGTLPLVHADPDRVKQVLYNLMGNAMRFVEKGGVSVRAEVQGKQLKVFITDTGAGISPEGQNLLFHKFQQAGNSILTRDNTRGTGLGLYISRLLLEHMQGEIKLESSKVGQGSTFSFTLPLAPAPKAAKTPKAPKPPKA